jgi:hypothetical protein
MPPAETGLADCPSYQVYMCLAFVVRTGLLTRHGRQGYTIPDTAEPAGQGGQAGFVRAVAAAYAALPVR